MKCDQCDNEATLHDLKMIKGGIVSQVHLCESCAAKLGLVTQSFSTVDDLIKQSIAQQAGVQVSVQVQGGEKSGGGGGRTATTCPACGLNWSEFREKGLFGCPECYTAFEGRIGNLLERAHEGGTHHVGKCPSRFTEKVDHAAHMRHLRKQLDDAITAEQYEKAAQLRDAIASYSSRFGVESGNGEHGTTEAESEANGQGLESRADEIDRDHPS